MSIWWVINYRLNIVFVVEYLETKLFSVDLRCSLIHSLSVCLSFTSRVGSVSSEESSVSWRCLLKCFGLQIKGKLLMWLRRAWNLSPGAWVILESGPQHGSQFNRWLSELFMLCVLMLLMWGYYQNYTAANKCTPWSNHYCSVFLLNFVIIHS